jgi:Protein of unknown function (DUF3035)
MKFRLILGAATLACLSTTLAGCGSTGVFDRDRPDEFAVTKLPALDVPADMNALPAPTPGQNGKADNTKQQVLDAMFGTPKA